VPDERDTRIAELERRLRARNAAGIRAPVALICLLGSLYLLWRELPDAAYAVSSSQPITRGREGDYRFDLLAANRYVQVHGTPTGAALWGQDRQGPFLVVALQDTPLLVRRPPLAGESWTPGRPPSPPLQTAFAIRGRLLREDQATAYREAFTRARQMAGIRARDGMLWIVVEGERPGEDRGALVTVALLALFAALNGWFALRSLRRQGPKRAG
jgi:hypothetical protein